MNEKQAVVLIPSKTGKHSNARVWRAFKINNLQRPLAGNALYKKFA